VEVVVVVRMEGSKSIDNSKRMDVKSVQCREIDVSSYSTGGDGRRKGRRRDGLEEESGEGILQCAETEMNRALRYTVSNPTLTAPWIRGREGKGR
jgi:hypothetical protein